jgi:UDP-N-acetylmuramate--alanine ligase
MSNNIKKVHVCAAGGIGMSALALLYLQKGYKVSISDIKKSDMCDELVKKGCVFFDEKDPLEENLEALVYSSAIKKDHPKLVEAEKKQIKILHRSEALQLFMKDKKALLVAGTHGKTTTSALLTHALKELGQKPSYAIGGKLCDMSDHAKLDDGDYFVAEADESDGSFLNYNPEAIIITNIEQDHMDFWKNAESLEKGFYHFAKLCKNPKLRICYDGCPQILNLEIAKNLYGNFQESQIQLLLDEPSEIGRRLFIRKEDETLCCGEVALNGHHNALNAVGCLSLLYNLGFKMEDILKTFETFKGVYRRCQVKGLFGQTLFIDDYGHHPTEIRSTIEGLKERFSGKTFTVIFQPHRFSRTHDLWNEFHTSFFKEDKIIVTDIYAAGELNPYKLHAKDLAKKIDDQISCDAQYIPREELKAISFNTDFVVTFGAGDITSLFDEIKKK